MAVEVCREGKFARLCVGCKPCAHDKQDIWTGELGQDRLPGHALPQLAHDSRGKWGCRLALTGYGDLSNIQPNPTCPVHEAAMDIVIYHNPDCGTSRNTLATLKASGYEPTVVEYLKTGWTRSQLQGLFAAAGITPREALRIKRAPAEELGLTRDGVSADELLDAMVEHPVLVNRPIVCTKKGVKMCRPSDQVLDLIDQWPPGPYEKEDGSLLIDADGKRVG